MHKNNICDNHYYETFILMFGTRIISGYSYQSSTLFLLILASLILFYKIKIISYQNHDNVI